MRLKRPRLKAATFKIRSTSMAACVSFSRPARVAGLILLIAALLISVDAAAEEEGAEPFVPPADGFDWVQLTSGEWLKGEIIALYDDELRFDSEILDTLEIDIEDIGDIFGRRPFAVGLQDYGTIVGEVHVS